MALGLQPRKVMHRRVSIAALAGIAAGLLASSGNAVATETAPDLDPSRSYAVRFQVPFAGILASHDDQIEGLEVLGISVGARLAHLYEVEAVGSHTSWICGSGSVVQARAGVSPSLIKARADGTHWNLRAPVLLGFLGKSGEMGCDNSVGNDLMGMLLSTGLDATRWSSSGPFGFTMRALFGMGPGWSKELNYRAKDGNWERAGWMLEASLMLGIAFH